MDRLMTLAARVRQSAFYGMHYVKQEDHIPTEKEKMDSVVLLVL